jgi:hypothetical protein
MKYIFVVFALVLSIASPAEAQKDSKSSYRFACLQGGCSFVCYPSTGVKGEALFQRHNVKEVDFLERGGTGVATVHVLNERPTVIRLGGTVFCEMPNGIVRAGHSFP